jgi:hypothetical protein
MRKRYKALLLLEVVVCFVPAALLWMVGALMLPMQLAFFRIDPENWAGIAFFLAPLVFGLCGLASLVYVLGKLLGSQTPIRRSALVLTGAALGYGGACDVRPADAHGHRVRGTRAVLGSKDAIRRQRHDRRAARDTRARRAVRRNRRAEAR